MSEKTEISALQSEIAELSVELEIGRAVVEQVKEQLSSLRQIVDYILFAPPSDGKSDSDLYPVTIWTRDQFKTIQTQLQALSESRNLSPEDDLDIRLQDLRDFIEERSRRWRFYENFFYGLVVLLLLTNLSLLVWLAAF